MIFRMSFVTVLGLISFNIINSILNNSTDYISFAYFLEVLSTLDIDFSHIINTFSDFGILFDNIVALINGNISLSNITDILGDLISLPFELVYALLYDGFDIVSSLFGLVGQLLFI